MNATSVSSCPYLLYRCRSAVEDNARSSVYSSVYSKTDETRPNKRQFGLAFMTEKTITQNHHATTCSPLMAPYRVVSGVLASDTWVWKVSLTRASSMGNVWPCLGPQNMKCKIGNTEVSQGFGG